MANATSQRPSAATDGEIPALPGPSLGDAHGPNNTPDGFHHLVALARLMGRQAAADAIRAGAMPASNQLQKET